MEFKEIVEKADLSQKEVAQILGLSINTVSKRINNPNSEVKVRELKLIEDAVGRPLYINQKIHPIKEYDQLKIPYLEIEGIDSKKLHSSIILERLQSDNELCNGHWKVDQQNLRIVPMLGDKMDEGRYPLKNGDILIVDISKRNIARSGIYVYTMGVGKEKDVYINNIDKIPDGRVRMSFYNRNYPEFIYHIDELKALDFKVHARVFKNMSLHL